MVCLTAALCRSITDELETVCGLLSPSRNEHLSLGDSVQRVRHASEMSNPEMAMYLEKETLRDAEESDYQLMSDLIQHRYHPDDHASQLDRERFGNNAFFLTVTDETVLERPGGPSASSSLDKTSVRPLVRAAAVEAVEGVPVPGEATPETLTPLSSPLASSSPSPAVSVSSPLTPTPTTTAIVHKAPPRAPPRAPLAVQQSSTSSSSSSSVSSIPYGNTETLC